MSTSERLEQLHDALRVAVGARLNWLFGKLRKQYAGLGHACGTTGAARHASPPSGARLVDLREERVDDSDGIGGLIAAQRPLARRR